LIIEVAHKTAERLDAEEDRMIRAFAIAMLSILILSTAALGQHQGTPQQQSACRHDATRFCRQQVDDYAIADCLRANMARLRPVCRAVMEGRR
jgi:hypothetical protein